jgi:xylulokinase
MDIYLAIDVGTTGLKVAIIQDSGKILASEYTEYPLLSPQPGYAEQDPQAWWQGLIEGCKNLQQKFPQEFSKIIGIGICGQMHTQVYLDKESHILRPAITWMDQRSDQIVAAINNDPDSKALVFQETKNFATTTYTAPQVRWVKDNQPEVWSQVSHILVAKDFLKYRLTGKMATDYSEASGTLLFDVEKCIWSEDTFKLFDISPSFFPEALPSDQIIGTVSEEAARLTGIKAGTPVNNGSTDCSAAPLGAGMVKSGQVTLIIGTAGVVSVCSDRPLVDEQNRTLCWNYCLRDKWATLGVMQTAGESLNWFKQAFDPTSVEVASGDIFDAYNQVIQYIHDGSDGLVFLPYLNGERTPYWDSAVRGVYFGINLSTTKGNFIKAIMEGVSFAFRNCVETIESLGIEIDEIRAVGGGLKSPVWLNTLGKILKKPVYTVEMPDTGLIGNMILCRHALQLDIPIEDTVKNIVKFAQKIHYPEPQEVYEKQYAIFLALYENLKDTFRASLT